MGLLPHAQSHPPDRGAANRREFAAGDRRAHRRYTRKINFRQKWRGYLWQGRFASFVMDEPYLLAAARYVELNPVRRSGSRCGGVALEQRQGTPDRPR